jgi:hypothetical protein
MSSRYEVHWYSDNGNRKEILNAFNTLQYVRAENNYGMLILTIPLGDWRYDDFRLNDMFEVWREKAGVTSLQNETAYFLRDWELYADSDGRHFVDLYAKDANFLLDSRIVGYAADTTQAKKTDYADDMIKEIVKQNMAGLAAAARQISTITVEDDLSDSVSITKGFAWRNILKVCQEIAETATSSGTYTCFDMIRTGVNSFRFRTYTGQRGIDHGKDSGDPRPVGEAYGNLVDAQLGTYHSEEINYIYAGGQGQQDDRIVVEESDDDRIAYGYPYNRIEAFHDARHCETEASVEAEADSALRNSMPRKIITGTLADTEGMQFGIDYGFGDIVNVQAFGHSVDCHISSMMVKVGHDSEEQLSIRLRGEL